jgi:hypothetical protein
MDFDASFNNAVGQIVEVLGFHGAYGLQPSGRLKRAKIRHREKRLKFFLCAPVPLCQKTAIGLTGDLLPPSTGIGAPSA